MYIADTYNYRIRKVTVSNGIITTIAGTTSAGYSGDNGAATTATLYDPSGVAVDSSGRHHAYFTFFPVANLISKKEMCTLPILVIIASVR